MDGAVSAHSGHTGDVLHGEPVLVLGQRLIGLSGGDLRHSSETMHGDSADVELRGRA